MIVCVLQWRLELCRLKGEGGRQRENCQVVDRYSSRQTIIIYKTTNHNDNLNQNHYKSIMLVFVTFISCLLPFALHCFWHFPRTYKNGCVQQAQYNDLASSFMREFLKYSRLWLNNLWIVFEYLYVELNTGRNSWYRTAYIITGGGKYSSLSSNYSD